MMHRNRSVNVHQFAMVPRADIPRASFNMQKAHKTTFDAGYLIPVFCEEILPGDTFRVKMTAFARLATPIFPLMDNLYLDSFFFFVPNRLTWAKWVKFMGEQDNPGDSTSYLVPHCTSPDGGFPVGGVYDYFGLPTLGQVDVAGSVEANSLPLRAYNLIWNEWFRDENMQDKRPMNKDWDGPDAISDYQLMKRGKRHDYFTSCLPFPQKGDSVQVPMGTSAPIVSDAFSLQFSGANGALVPLNTTGTSGSNITVGGSTGSGPLTFGPAGTPVPGFFADLSQATAATINQIRQSFQIQRLLERDARGGTRYTELVRAHFGVISPDARLQRPEYLGGGSAPIVFSPIAQTSATGQDGATTPLGNLSGIATVLARNHGFTQSFTEHGYVIGLVSVRGDLTYQQGLRRMWSRKTRFDFYFPAFAMLGEQAVLNKEIFCTGLDVTDNEVFGYQERWAEYRYSPSMVTGYFRSTTAGTLDSWHIAQRFATVPSLGHDFIQENPPLERILAVGPDAQGAQFIFDSFFDMQVARPMPLYSVPGLIDHF